MSVISNDVEGVYVRIDDERNDRPLSLVIGNMHHAMSIESARLLVNVLSAYATFAEVRANTANLQYDGGARRESITRDRR